MIKYAYPFYSLHHKGDWKIKVTAKDRIDADSALETKGCRTRTTWRVL